VKQAFVILVCIDIVDSTQFIESQGDVRASQVMRVYDQIFRGLLIKYNGLEIDKTDGALLIFETMREALQYITAYHAMIEHHLNLKSRAGIHCGPVVMFSNNEQFVARGAKPIEVDGIHKVITARIMSVAGGGQTLMSQRAGEYAASVRGQLLMKNIGVWSLKGVKAPLKLFAISASNKRLYAPQESEKVKLIKPPPLTPRERWKRRFNRYVLPVILLFSAYTALCFITVLEFLGKIDIYATELHALIIKAVRSVF
jgi:class 3 adenylate cyclase